MPKRKNTVEPRPRLRGESPGKGRRADPRDPPRRLSRGKPPRRGQTQVVAFVRDPSCLFTFWEAEPEDVEKIRRRLANEFVDSRMVLMVFRMGTGGHAELVREIRIGPEETNRYVGLEGSGGSYFVEIGWKTPSGRKARLARSNRVTAWMAGGAAGGEDPAWLVPEKLEEYFLAQTFPHPSPLGIFSAERGGDRREKPAGRPASWF
jgi:Domain of unknown function (DUF4912)